MRTPSLLRLAAILLFLALVPSPPALPLDRGDFSLEILVGGRPLEEHPARGTTYIEASKGREYSIRLRNRTGERVAVALSVDGLNTIDARTTSASEARKWILEPYGSVVLEGWQTGMTTARRFFFTDEARSYGAWLGNTDNLGTISAAFFRERRPDPPLSILRDQAAPAPHAPAGRLEKRAAASEAESDAYAATGIGREREHRVRVVDFEPEASPRATLTVRYEYRDALVRLGVLPLRDRCDERLARRERARGFEDDGFAPDPFRRDR